MQICRRHGILLKILKDVVAKSWGKLSTALSTSKCRTLLLLDMHLVGCLGILHLLTTASKKNRRIKMHKNKYKIMVEPLIPRSAVYLICLYTFQIVEEFFVRNSYFVWTIHGVAIFQRLFRILPKSSIQISVW